MLDVLFRHERVHVERDDVLGGRLEFFKHPSENLRPERTLPERRANVQRHHRFDEPEHVDERPEARPAQDRLAPHLN